MVTLTNNSPSMKRLLGINENSSLSSATHQQKRVLGNVKLGNSNFKVSQKVKDITVMSANSSSEHKAEDVVSLQTKVFDQL